MFEVTPQGDQQDDLVDSGNPVKIGGIARQTNRTAVGDGDRVNAAFDDMGRQLTRPYQVRDLIVTATASLTTGTKTVLVSGTAGSFLDLMQISCSNNSDAATTVTLTDESTSVHVIPVAANFSSILNFDPPIPQSATGQLWAVDLPDITGTTITVLATFSREV